MALRNGTAAASLVATLLAATTTLGCGGSDNASQQSPRQTRSTLGLWSSAFLDGERIPARFTCDGENVSPPLSWSRVPGRARSLALLVEDVDAPGGTFVHWSVYDLARGSSGTGTGRVPSGAAEGENSFGDRGYGGPCPPKGDAAHRYVFHLFALDDALGLAPGAAPADVRQAISRHAITTGTLSGGYSR